MNLKKLLSLALIVLAMPACSLKNPADLQGGLSIILQDTSRSLSRNLSRDFFLMTMPTSTGDFNCFAVNVTGPGIIKNLGTLTTCTSSDNMKGKGFGILSKPAQRNQAINLMVPSGYGRNISVFGVYPSTEIEECGGTNTGSNSGEGYYLGETTIDLTGPASVVVPINYDGAASDVTCTGDGSSQSISTIFPDGGLLGTVISINGNGFDAGSTVEVGGINCPVVNNTGTTISCTIPSLGAAGAKTVTVTSPNSEVLTSPVNFEYVTGTTAYLSIDTDSSKLNFGSVPVGTPVDHTLTIMNSGYGTASVVTGDFTTVPAGFTISAVAGPCVSLVAGTSCTFTLTLNAGAVGSYNGTLVLTDIATSSRTISGTVY